ncbi:MAG: PEP-CTERM sorting domain-containing protein [Opitutaceae bacterium]|jgi:hypothetical protein
MNTLHRLLALPVLVLTVATTHAGTFADINVLDASDADWAAIPATVTGATGNTVAAGTLDVTEIKFANNATDLFILVRFAEAVNPNQSANDPYTGFALYFGVDRDSSYTTGNNIFGVNQVGVEARWANDYPISEVGGALSSQAYIGNYNQSTSFQEYRIPLNTSFVGGSLDGQSVFGSGPFTFVFYTAGNGPLGGFDDFVVSTYTFAAIPEPSTYVALAGLAILGFVLHRRRAVRNPR